MEDQRLLTRFIKEDSQAAFARLVERHRDLVYSTCRRELSGSGPAAGGLAEDATQVVFLLLAQKAKSLRHEVVLTGWLFQTARFAAKDLLKHERRRSGRDNRIGAEMLDREGHEEDAMWREVSPWLHESLAQLNEKDRLAILLRFFDDRSFPEIALALGQKEDAARHRVNRALEKMRRMLSSRGVVVPAAMLGGLLAANAIKPAPAFAAVFSASPGSFHSGAPHLQQLTRGVSRAMSVKQNLAAGAAVCICVALGAGAGLAKNTHPIAGTPKSPAPSPGASQNKKILGTWTSYVQGHPKQTQVIRFNPDGTFRQNLNVAGTAFCTGRFVVENDVLNVTAETVTVKGKSSPVLPQDVGATTGKLSYGGDTVTWSTSYHGTPFKNILVRRKAELSAEGGLG